MVRICGVKMKSRVTWADQLTIYEAAHELLKLNFKLPDKLRGLLIYLRPRNFKKLREHLRLISIQMQAMTQSKWLSWRHSKHSKEFLKYIKIQGDGKSDGDFKSSVLAICSQVGIKYGTLPYPTAEQTTPEESKHALIEIYKDEIRQRIARMCDWHNPKLSNKSINRLKTHINRIKDDVEILELQRRLPKNLLPSVKKRTGKIIEHDYWGVSKNKYIAKK